MSIPNIRGDVDRPPLVTIRYKDETFAEFLEMYHGFNARVIQHEYDPTEGVLFTDKLKPVKKALIRRRLDNIRKRQAYADYRIKITQ